MSSNDARNVETMCSTAKWTDEWVRSMSYVPVNGMMAVDTVLSLSVGWSSAFDLRAGGREHVPLRPVHVQALAVGLSRLRVLHEPVEGVAGVRDLARPVRAAYDAEQRLLCRAAAGRLAVGEERRPVRRAGAGAAAVALRSFSKR